MTTFIGPPLAGGPLPPPPVTFEVLTVFCLVGVVGPAVGTVMALVF